MSITAKLKVILLVDETQVAESESSKLWQIVFDTIRKESLPKDSLSDQDTSEDLRIDENEENHTGDSDDFIQSFAQKIGVSKQILQGACSPAATPPYIHLDKHHWEALKKSIPKRGPGGIAMIVIAATILSVWKEHLKASIATKKESQTVLKTIGLYDDKPDRGLENCDWLQLRGENIQINPANVSKAIELVRAYCQKESPSFIQKTK